MGAYKVVVTENRFQDYSEEQKVLDEVQAVVDVQDCRTQDEVVGVVRDADGVLLSQMKITAEVIREMSRCKVISRYGVGYDNVDIDAATAAGIWVARVPNYGAEEPVTDQALALLFACVRKVAFKDRRIREGGWNLKSKMPCYTIAGKTMGIVGFGVIGRRMFEKCRSLGFDRILVCDPYVDPEQITGAGGVAASKDMLIEQADFISLHLPLNQETTCFIAMEELVRMKDTAIVVNTARGPVVNETDLAKALANGVINSAGIDVFGSEPIPDGSPLLALDNVVLSDHTGFYSEETMKVLQRKAAQNVLEVLKGNVPVSPVNHIE